LNGPFADGCRRLENVAEAEAEGEDAVVVGSHGTTPDLVRECDIVRGQGRAVMEGRINEVTGDRQTVVADCAWLRGQVGDR
jgi:hypothetical protein